MLEPCANQADEEVGFGLCMKYTSLVPLTDLSSPSARHGSTARYALLNPANLLLCTFNSLHCEFTPHSLRLKTRLHRYVHIQC